MLIDYNPQMIHAMFPQQVEVRQYVSEGSPYPNGWFPEDSLFNKHSDGYLIPERAQSATSSNYQRVFVSFSSDNFDEENANENVEATHADIRETLDKLCFELKLSKSALSEILGVSRQTIYDWTSGKNKNFQADNISKIDWLNELSDSLDGNLKGKLWLWRNKRLSSGVTIQKALSTSEITPQDLANEINIALNKGKDVPRLVSKSQEAARRDLLDKSVPFSSDE